MVNLVKDGIIMVVTDDMAEIFKKSGYAEAVEESAASTVIEETVNHDETVIEKDIEDKSYSKTDINRMSKDGLTSLAKENGLKVGEDESGNSLKKRLIELLVK